jgi:hypothetical protein
MPSPPFLVPDVKNLTVDEMNEMVASINRALTDLYRGTIYASRGSPTIQKEQLAPDVITVINTATSTVVTDAANAAAISGVVASGIAAISGVVLSSILGLSGLVTLKMGNPIAGSGRRMDAGEVSFSGWVREAVSTALSSIRHMTIAPVRYSGFVNTDYSGVLAEFLSYSSSGHCFDLYRHCVVSGGTATGIVTSGGISGIVSWIAVGY